MLAPTQVSPQVATPRRRPRVWPAALVLFLLPGLTAEPLTGSTPILVYFLNPISGILNTLLYGSGALLIREVARRRGLGWASVMLMGGAYGIFEEGLVVNTWANPWLPQVCAVVHGKAQGICDYGRVGPINWSWASSLTVFHALVSITIPILLVELLFPRVARLPWLGRRSRWLLVLALLLALAFGLLINVASYRQHHRAGPPLGPYLFEALLMAALFWLALRLRPRPDGASPSSKRAPRLWSLRVLAFFAILLNTALASLFQGAKAPFQAEYMAYAVFALLVFWRLAAVSRRTGWNDERHLALATGALGFFILLWDPILELIGSAGGNSTRGTLVWALLYLLMLILLARRVPRRKYMSGHASDPRAAIHSPHVLILKHRADTA